MEMSFEDAAYTPWEGTRVETLEYPAMADAEVEDGSTFFYMLALGNLTPEERVLADVMTSAMNLESSTLQRLARERLPFATISSAIDIDYSRNHLMIYASNVDASEYGVFQEIVEEALKDLGENGIAQDIVRIVSNQMKMSAITAREASNIGVSLSESLSAEWVTAGDPFAYMDELEAMMNMEELSENGALNTFVQKVFEESQRENHQALYTCATPAPGLSEQQTAEYQESLRAKKAAMTEEEIAALVQETADYNAWLAENEEINNIDQVKVVDVATLPEEYEAAQVQETVVDGLTILTSPIENEEYISLELYFNASGVPADQIGAFTVWAAYLGNLETGTHTLEDLQLAVGQQVDSLSVTSGTLDYEDGGYQPVLAVSVTMLKDQLPDALALMKEILLDTRFTDLNEIRSQASESAYYVSYAMNASPYGYAQLLYSLATQDSGAWNYAAALTQYPELVNTMAQMEDEELTAMLQEIIAVGQSVLTRADVTLAVIANEENTAAAVAGVQEFLALLPEGEPLPQVPNAPEERIPARTALVVDGSVQYVVAGGNRNELGYSYSIYDYVTAQLASDQVVIPMLRFTNNVYSASFAVARVNTTLVSYRDPGLKSTLDFYAALPMLIRRLSPTQEELDGYILKTYAGLATPTGKISAASSALSSWMTHCYNPERVPTYMKQLKAMTPEDCVTCADTAQLAVDKGVVIVVGGAEQIEKNADLFDLILYSNDF